MERTQAAVSAKEEEAVAPAVPPGEPEGDRRGRSGVTWILAVIALLFVGLPYLLGSGGEPGEPLTPESGRRGFVAFALPDDAGGTYDLLPRSKGKVVLVNFWATWCEPCREEIPALERIAEKYRSQGLETVGVSLDTNGPDAVRSFASEMGLTYPIAMGADSPVAAYGAQGIPATLLLDRRGRVAKSILGRVDERALSKDIETLLREPAGTTDMKERRNDTGSRGIAGPLPPFLFGR